ncbi:RDD family protein [Pontibacillus yanchengensis]|nr:RDD family protein [Pontibacillus yanchengensis]
MLKYASFGRRFLADILDYLLFGLVVATIIFFVTGEFSLVDASDSIYFELSHLLYMTLLPLLWSGYIVGKRIFNIYVTKDDQPLTLTTMALREIFGKYILAGLTLGITLIISFFMVNIREDRRAIHDLIAGTYVVHGKPAKT